MSATSETMSTGVVTSVSCRGIDDHVIELLGEGGQLVGSRKVLAKNERCRSFETSLGGELAGGASGRLRVGIGDKDARSTVVELPSDGESEAGLAYPTLLRDERKDHLGLDTGAGAAGQVSGAWEPVLERGCPALGLWKRVLGLRSFGASVALPVSGHVPLGAGAGRWGSRHQARDAHHRRRGVGIWERVTKG